MKPLCIVAVSGGVDSVVLLHKLVRANEARLVVAHIDHGLRPESGEDAQFVARLAGGYGLQFESTALQLGDQVSEEYARQGRWQFLRKIREKYHADYIVTAHHADDIVETMIINLKRGTGWRGIATLRETDEIKRPLLVMRKREIIDYAREHELQWREDATNQDERYLRNYVRHRIIPCMSDQQFRAWIQLHTRQLELREQIEREVGLFSPVLSRYHYVMWPDNSAREFLRASVGSLTRREFDRLLLFVRTARPQKQLALSNGKTLKMGVKRFIVLEAQD